VTKLDAPGGVRCEDRLMIERLPDMPSGTLGFRATGKIQRADYDEVLAPELRRALEARDGLRTLYLVEDLDEIEPRALCADSKLGFDIGLRHRDAWVRSAIVTDIGWMARAARMFAWMIPGEARIFPVAELDRAKAWVAGDAEGGHSS
jgi:SpoIIAA-like